MQCAARNVRHDFLCLLWDRLWAHQGVSRAAFCWLLTCSFLSLSPGLQETPRCCLAGKPLAALGSGRQPGRGAMFYFHCPPQLEGECGGGMGVQIAGVQGLGARDAQHWPGTGICLLRGERSCTEAPHLFPRANTTLFPPCPHAQLSPLVTGWKEGLHDFFFLFNLIPVGKALFLHPPALVLPPASPLWIAIPQLSLGLRKRCFSPLPAQMLVSWL